MKDLGDGRMIKETFVEAIGVDRAGMWKVFDL
jgi:hypothetical protein